MTYSIVARDAETGELGVAVQSRAFNTGAACAWAEAGVGAIATQSFTERRYGPRGLALLGEGRDPREALDELLAADDGREMRQVAFVDTSGATAAHTGSQCIPHAGHLSDANVSVQGNMLRSPEVWPAMREAFDNTTGTLAERLLAALDGAEHGRQERALAREEPRHEGAERFHGEKDQGAEQRDLQPAVERHVGNLGDRSETLGIEQRNDEVDQERQGNGGRQQDIEFHDALLRAGLNRRRRR